MTLSERLMKITEEKVKLECENQQLRENCIRWQKACNLRDKCINDILEDKKEISAERHQLAMENIELETYVRAAKRVFEQCGEYIYIHQDEFAIFKFDIEKLGLYCFGVKERKDQPIRNLSNGDDILNLFKQSSKGI